MKKINTTPISGMQELLPDVQATFDQLKSNISRVYRAHGFQHIETPTIDRTDILLAKAGGDTEKQIYKVVKTAESAGEADQALRFDHTVPLARYVVEHESSLAFPFKVTQIGRNFRGERAQKGRFREFYQCDVDVIGRGNLPIYYDAEVISTLYEALESLNLPFIEARISNRKLLTGLLAGMNLEQHAAEIFSIVDHAEKVPAAVTKQALLDLNIGEENVVKITTFINIRGDRDTVVKSLENLGVNNEIFSAGIAELTEVLSFLAEENLGSHVIADMLIVRGLDYYTGTVFEFRLPDYASIGSICGGGRYDNLAEYYTDQPLPGVGGSIGLTRLFYVLNSEGLLKDAVRQPVDLAIIPLSKNEYPFALALASKLRRSCNKTVDLVLTDKKLGEKLGYAGKIAKLAIVVGEEEVKTNQLTVKNLLTGESEPFSHYIEHL